MVRFWNMTEVALTIGVFTLLTHPETASRHDVSASDKMQENAG